MDIEFSQIHEMVYMHDIVNSDSKKKPRIPLKKFLNAEKVLTQTTSWALNSRFVNVNSVNKVNVKSKVKSGYWICPYISRHLLSLNPLLACCRRYSRGER